MMFISSISPQDLGNLDMDCSVQVADRVLPAISVPLCSIIWDEVGYHILHRNPGVSTGAADIIKGFVMVTEVVARQLNQGLEFLWN
jgi:hypothetical protein